MCRNFNAGYCADGVSCQFKHVYTCRDLGIAMKLVVPKTKPAATQESESVSHVNSFLPSFVKIGGVNK